MIRIHSLLRSRYIRNFSSGYVSQAKNEWTKKRTWQQIATALPSAPTPVLKVVHECYEDIPLDDQQRLTLKNYIKENKEISSVSKSIMLKYLMGKKEYDIIDAMAQSHLLDDKGNYLENCSTNAILIYLEALIQMNQLERLTTETTKYISQFSISKQGTSVYMINAIFVKLYHNCSPEVALNVWAKLVTAFYGHCELTSFEIYQQVMSHLLYFFKFSKNSHRCIIPLLDQILKTDSLILASHLSTTLLTFYAHSRWFKEIELLWDWKVTRNLPVVASDLTAIMRTKCHFKEWDSVIELHEKYSLAHNDYSQFDYLLISMAKKEDWESLKSQFDALFGIGKLPTVNHYGIVMFALSLHGELELIERLHGQLIRRNMTPSYAVLLSIINAHYKSGDFNGAIREFAQFRRYDIRPTSSVFLIMLKVYKKLGSLDSCFKILKTMSSSNTPIYETHFKIIIDLCGKYDNYPVAEELFKIMISDYFIEPTGRTVAALAHVFLNSKEYKKAIALIEKYENTVAEGDHLIFKQKITYYIKTNNVDKAEAALRDYYSKNQPRDSQFYLILLQHLVHGRRDNIAAEKVLEELIRTKSSILKSEHFNILLEEYTRIGYFDGVSNLVGKIVDNEIAMNSKTLYFLVRSRFEVQDKRRESYDFLIGWLEEILQNISEKKLNFTTTTLHPSVITWPMNFLARNDDPSKAVELFTKYVKLFFPKTKEWNQKLTIIRALLIVSAESGKWQDFDILFQRYQERLDFYRKAPSSLAPNSNLNSAYVGILEYKIERMKNLKELDNLPNFLDGLEKDGYKFSNKVWNDILWVLIRRKDGFHYAMKKLNETFLYGYNCIHKVRHLKVLQSELASYDYPTDDQGDSLRSKKVHYYLAGSNYKLFMEQIDKYIRRSDKGLEAEIKCLLKSYPYAMRQYLLKERKTIPDWYLIEKNHAAYLGKLRRTKKHVPIEEF